jgi:hypothetical protein
LRLAWQCAAGLQASICTSIGRQIFDVPLTLTTIMVRTAVYSHQDSEDPTSSPPTSNSTLPQPCPQRLKEAVLPTLHSLLPPMRSTTTHSFRTSTLTRSRFTSQLSDYGTFAYSCQCNPHAGSSKTCFIPLRRQSSTYTFTIDDAAHHDLVTNMSVGPTNKASWQIDSGYVAAAMLRMRCHMQHYSMGLSPIERPWTVIGRIS